MRALLALLLCVGCRKAGETDNTTVPLEPELAAPPVIVEAPDANVVDDPTLGIATPSKPQGAPVAITIAPQKVGDKRTRSLESRGVFEFEYENKHRQLSHNRYELLEELQSIDATGRTFRVTAKRATEAIQKGVQPFEATTLVGSYIVLMRPNEKPAIGREDGGEIGGREVEELADLMSFDSGAPNGLVEIVAKRPLRVGETYKLTKDENILYGGGREVLGDIYFTLLRVDGKRATYQANVSLDWPVEHEGDTHTRKLRYTLVVDTTTGRLHELQEVHRTLEISLPRDGKPASRQYETRHLVMKLTY